MPIEIKITGDTADEVVFVIEQLADKLWLLAKDMPQSIEFKKRSDNKLTYDPSTMVPPKNQQPVNTQTDTFTPPKKEAEPTKTPTEPTVQQPTATATFEQIRARLTEMAQSGKRDEAKAILNKYGYEKLKDVKPEHFDAIYQDSTEVQHAAT